MFENCRQADVMFDDIRWQNTVIGGYGSGSNAKHLYYTPVWCSWRLEILMIILYIIYTNLFNT